MARPKKNFEPKKEALTRLAFDMFIEHGYEDTTITHIMKTAGLTKAGMYHYFSSKEEILDAAIDYGISLDIEKTLEDMDGLDVKDKMLLFIQGNTVQNEFFRKTLQIKQNNRNSFAAYRIRERLIHAYIPIMEGILKEGNKTGVYRTEHPRQTAEFAVLFAKALVEPNILPVANNEDLKLRTHMFFQLMHGLLNTSSEHEAEIAILIENMLSAMQMENE